MSKNSSAAAPTRESPASAPSPDIHPEPPSVDDPRLTTWRAFLYAQSTVMPRLDAEVRAASGLTLAEFDALVQLAFAPEYRLRMSVLAERVLLSRSGVTRLVDRLERDSHVQRESCAPDGRGAYAVLTEQGAERVRDAMPGHLAAVDAHFLGHIDPEDMSAIARALARVAEANGRPLPSPEKSAAVLAKFSDARRSPA